MRAKESFPGYKTLLLVYVALIAWQGLLMLLAWLLLRPGDVQGLAWWVGSVLFGIGLLVGGGLFAMARRNLREPTDRFNRFSAVFLSASAAASPGWMAMLAIILGLVWSAWILAVLALLLLWLGRPRFEYTKDSPKPRSS